MKRLLNLFLIICMLTGCGQKAIPPAEVPSPPVIVEEAVEATPAPEPEIEVDSFAVDTVEAEEVESEIKIESAPAEEVLAVEEVQAPPAPTAAPTATPAPTKAPAQVPMNYGSIPFSLSEFQYDWWSIDSSDDAYWACASNINAMRRAAGLSELAVDGGLSAIANSRCEEIVASGDFSHAGMCTAGEILAENYNSASAACSAWQASSGHYAQIIGGYSSMGIGCVFEQGGQTVWCVVFS